jgi:hypothetical protein
MHVELKESWEAYHKLNVAHGLVHSPEQLHSIISDMQEHVCGMRQQAEDYLLSHLDDVPVDTGMYCRSFRLMRLADAAPNAGPLDLVRVAICPGLILSFNPFLCQAACSALHEGVITWLQLCVLEDRIGRIRLLAHAGPEYLPLLLQARNFECLLFGAQ